MRLIAVLTVALALPVAMVFATHVAVVPLPELGHFNPLIAVLEALHEDAAVKSTLLVPTFFVKNCSKAVAHVPRATCESYVTYEITQYDHKFFEALVERPALETISIVNKEVQDYQVNCTPHLVKALRDRDFDVVFSDFAMDFASSTAADAAKVPVVLIWPLVLQLPGVSRDPRLPAFGSALSIDMSLMAQIGNAVLQRASLVSMAMFERGLQYLRLREQLPASKPLESYRGRLMLTPSIFGLELAQPISPNVMPMGLLQPETSKQAQLPAEWERWLDHCNNSIIYVNMGSVGRLPPRWVALFERALLDVTEQDGMCVLWKLSAKQQESLTPTFVNERHRVAHWLPFSPREFFKRNAVSVFVTHCGVTSVYETIQYGSAFVGFPLFADQPDMCQRMQDAGLGVALDKNAATVIQFSEAIRTALRISGDSRRKMAELRLVSKLFGEKRRAADVLRLAAAGNGGAFITGAKPFIDEIELPVTAALALIIYVLTSLSVSAMRGLKRLVLRR
jgi:UDP:flavonoid glycosyltransferase YjiC (YdhE family)